MRRIMWLLGFLIAAGIIYDGWIFYSRWSGNRQAAQAQTARELNQERKTIDAYGGGDLKIVNFYAAPGAIRRGDHANLCYGVTGAKTVRMEPPAADPVWPSLTRCVQVSPKADTEFKLIAEDEAGHSVTQSVAVTVR
jgi:hypothetical protein